MITEGAEPDVRSLAMWMGQAMLRAICVFGLPPVIGESPLWVAMGELGSGTH